MTNKKNIYEKAEHVLKEWRDNHRLHTQRMQELCMHAQTAFHSGEVPVAASLWQGHRRVAMAHNLSETRKDPMMHAEYIVVRQFIQEGKDPFLDKCVLYVTLFPCSMCLEFLKRMRLRGLCYGTCPPEGPVDDVFPMVLGGVLQEECAELLQSFFCGKR